MEISDPTLAYLLVILGLTGIGIEAVTPGGFIPAILGIIAVIFGVIGMVDIGPTAIGLGLLLLAVAFFIAAVAFHLYRPFSIGGHVVRGQQLGRKLGYPTANIRLGRRTSPVGGIFAVQVHGAAAEALPGVASLGVRPTVNGTEPLLEAHLFDFDGDLYGRRLEVEFVQKLRDEAKFDDLDAMVRQIDRDADEARAILADRRPGAGQDPVPLPAIEEVRSLPVPG